jgi:hypothetical protein
MTQLNNQISEKIQYQNNCREVDGGTAATEETHQRRTRSTDSSFFQQRQQ